MKKIAIIPARSGSKGLKDKNIIDLCGKPLIAHTIQAAVSSGEFERIIVSTDSVLYADISRKCGAEVFMRKENLSSDTASTYDVLADIFTNNKFDIDYFALLQPTSPLRNASHIKEATALFEKNFNVFDFLVSLKEAEAPAVLVKQVEDDMSLKNFDTDFSTFRRQHFKDYSPNGAIYFGKVNAYLEHKHFYGAKSLAYFMTQEDSVDIDNYLDYELAKIIMTNRISK